MAWVQPFQARKLEASPRAQEDDPTHRPVELWQVSGDYTDLKRDQHGNCSGGDRLTLVRLISSSAIRDFIPCIQAPEFEILMSLATCPASSKT